MTHATKPVLRRTALPAATLAALLLAGCSTGHIGDSWQCPLAEGGACDSVAAADPAVPDARAAGGAGLPEPLWRVRTAEPGTSPGPGQAAETSCPAACDSGFDPFGWLARLFEAEAHEGAARPDAGPAMQSSDPLPGEEAALPAAARTAEPEAVALLAEPASLQTDMTQEDVRAGDLRTGEVVARIWIAPFVDADGVYREASHVRVVLEPAGWRVK